MSAAPTSAAGPSSIQVVAATTAPRSVFKIPENALPIFLNLVIVEGAHLATNSTSSDKWNKVFNALFSNELFAHLKPSFVEADGLPTASIIRTLKDKLNNTIKNANKQMRTGNKSAMLGTDVNLTFKYVKQIIGEKYQAEEKSKLDKIEEEKKKQALRSAESNALSTASGNFKRARKLPGEGPVTNMGTNAPSGRSATPTFESVLISIVMGDAGKLSEEKRVQKLMISHMLEHKITTAVLFENLNLNITDACELEIADWVSIFCSCKDFDAKTIKSDMEKCGLLFRDCIKMYLFFEGLRFELIEADNAKTAEAEAKAAEEAEAAEESQSNLTPATVGIAANNTMVTPNAPVAAVAMSSATPLNGNLGLDQADDAFMDGIFHDDDV